ncbi:MAG: HNH endonuclease [Gammaproteobacteria bacterium]|nr:HNH endonuclease [Gammaproteobacteria bacterium]
MQFWVGITDGEWFRFLAARRPQEVNFWQPSQRAPRRMEAGWPFLFKLHSPDDYIVGGGYFVRFTALPCFLAWEAFRENNGVLSLAGLIERTARYRHAAQTAGTVIGCNLLSEPFFFDRADWIPCPRNWSANIQRGLTYDTADTHGAGLWNAVLRKLQHIDARSAETVEAPRFGAEFLARARLGQGTFRILVTDAYHRRCAVTGEKTLPALEAAHIRAHAEAGPNRIDNGLLLRADIHRLFDDGYVTVDPDLRFVVSRRVREEFENGREYYRFHGAALANLPDRDTEHPSRAFLVWHNERVYKE